MLAEQPLDAQLVAQMIAGLPSLPWEVPELDGLLWPSLAAEEKPDGAE